MQNTLVVGEEEGWRLGGGGDERKGKKLKGGKEKGENCIKKHDKYFKMALFWIMNSKSLAPAFIYEKIGP